MWREDVSQWVLRCEICIESSNHKLVPKVTEWYVLASSEYPWGHIEFFPSEQNGLNHTFPHQSFNSQGKHLFPWRNGNLCLNTGLRALERHDHDIEPYDVHWRLYWRFERAIQWLDAASKEALALPGEHFELPSFPGKSSTTVVFTEGIESLLQWQKIPNSIGLLDLFLLDQRSNTIFIKAFKSTFGQDLLVPNWGKAMTEMTNERVTGIWVRLNQVPVLEPWQTPSNWKELRAVFREQEIEFDEQLRTVVKPIRDGKSHLLLIGFPIPSEVGGLPFQMHWQPIELPVLSSNTKTAKGFRANEVGYWQRDRTEILRGAKNLSWVKSENWHSEQISTRGRFSEVMTDKQVLLIGVGAVGSVVAELLIRGNIQRIGLIDSDKLEIGNLSRHTLNWKDLKESKAISVAERLNLASPHATVEAIECDFPFVIEEKETYIQQCDLILDCTGSDSTLHHLEKFSWQDEKVFISISLGMGGKRLFCFVSKGRTFPSHIFKEKLKPWLEKERDEYKEQPLPWSGVGCWHPVFPARADDVWMMSSVAVKHVESLMKSNSLSDELAVFEQVFDNNNNFCGVSLVDPHAGCK
jgi:molybdopterin/thiamine biosynthesis adenylyltransferase